MTCEKYEFPPDWEAMTDEEKSEWMLADRVRRQALRQDTAWADKAKKQIDRERRRLEAKNSFVIGRVEDNQ